MNSDISLECGCPGTPAGNRRVASFGLRASRYLPSCTIGKHHHPEARIVLPLARRFDTQYGRQFFRVDHGAAVYRPVGEEHVDTYELLTDCITLVLSDEDSQPSPRNPFVISDAGLASAARTLWVESRATDAASALILEGLSLLVSSVVLHRLPRAETEFPRWIHTVRERVDASHAAAPTLTELGKCVNRDPAYVAATFKRVYGTSVGTYLRHLRLWQARHRMDTDRVSSLSDVAHYCGFSDQSHFTRHFRRLFRVTPGEYRRRYGARQSACCPQPA
jgi:AraC-like DNA-binding protein